MPRSRNPSRPLGKPEGYGFGEGFAPRVVRGHSRRGATRASRNLSIVVVVGGRGIREQVEARFSAGSNGLTSVCGAKLGCTAPPMRNTASVDM